MSNKDFVNWLSTKLEEADWESDKVANAYTLENLTLLASKFSVLDPLLKTKILFSFLGVRKKQIPEFDQPIREILAIGMKDEDEWVRVISQLLNPFTQNQTIDLSPENESFQSTLNEMHKSIENKGEYFHLLPYESMYLSKDSECFEPLAEAKPKTSWFALRNSEKTVLSNVDIDTNLFRHIAKKRKNYNLIIKNPFKKEELPEETSVVPNMIFPTSLRPTKAIARPTNPSFASPRDRKPSFISVSTSSMLHRENANNSPANLNKPSLNSTSASIQSPSFQQKKTIPNLLNMDEAAMLEAQANEKKKKVLTPEEQAKKEQLLKEKLTKKQEKEQEKENKKKQKEEEKLKKEQEKLRKEQEKEIRKMQKENRDKEPKTKAVRGKTEKKKEEPGEKKQRKKRKTAQPENAGFENPPEENQSQDEEDEEGENSSQENDFHAGSLLEEQENQESQPEKTKARKERKTQLATEDDNVALEIMNLQKKQTKRQTKKQTNNNNNNNIITDQASHAFYFNDLNNNPNLNSGFESKPIFPSIPQNIQNIRNTYMPPIPNLSNININMSTLNNINQMNQTNSLNDFNNLNSNQNFELNLQQQLLQQKQQVEKQQSAADALLENCNKLSLEDRKLILDFMSNQNKNKINVSENEEKKRIVLNEEKKENPNAPGTFYLEQLIFEINYANQSWRKLRKKTAISTSENNNNNTNENLNNNMNTNENMNNNMNTSETNNNP